MAAATQTLPRPQSPALTSLVYCLIEQHASAICAEAGCPFRGIQHAVEEGDVARALILFDDSFRSTLCLTVADFDLATVRTKLAASAAKWAAARVVEPTDEKERRTRG